MNYLAHFLLGFGNNDLLVGQFIADEVKGKRYLDQKPEVANGILLHRFVDSFTDTDERVKELRALIRSELKLYSSPAIDIFFDHMLALRWNDFSDQALEKFATNTYHILQSRHQEMDKRSQHILYYMHLHNWLCTYQTAEGIGQVFSGMSQRVRGGEVLLKAPDVLSRNFVEVKNAFDNFFPRLIKACEQKRNSLGILS